MLTCPIDTVDRTVKRIFIHVREPIRFANGKGTPAPLLIHNRSYRVKVAGKVKLTGDIFP